MFLLLMSEILLSYLALIGMGITLGVLGAGGSIMSVPILMLGFNYDIVEAGALSLIIVGVTAAVGAVIAAKQRQVDWQAVLRFTPAAVAGVYLARSTLLPLIPTEVYGVSRDDWLMALLLVFMLLAAFVLLRPQDTAPQPHTRHWIWAVLEGFAVGIVTGLVGAGGGFLIVPALILLGGVSPQQAVGTSLVIIALKSLLGVLGDDLVTTSLDWQFLAVVLLTTTLGMLIGRMIQPYFNAEMVRRSFAALLLMVALLMIWQTWLV